MSLRNLLYASVLATSLGSPQYASAQEHNFPEPFMAGDISDLIATIQESETPIDAFSPNQGFNGLLSGSWFYNLDTVPPTLRDDYIEGLLDGYGHGYDIGVSNGASKTRREMSDGYNEVLEKAENYRRKAFFVGIGIGTIGGVFGMALLLGGRNRKEE